MRQELLGALRQEVAQVQGEAVSLISNAANQGNQTLVDFEQRAMKQMGEQYDKLSNQARSGWEESSGAIRQRIDDLIQQASTDRKKLIDRVDSSAGELRQSVSLLGYQLQAMQYELHEDKGTYMQLAAAKEMVTRALEIGWDYYIAHSLSSLVKALKKDDEHYADDVAEITVLMDKVPGQYSVIVEEVRRLLRESPSK